MRRFEDLDGHIERRLVVNLRVDPEAVAGVLPPPLRPHLVGGHAIAGVCLIALRDLRPAAAPGSWGLRSENLAHRVAVEWDEGGERRTGVWIPNRFSSSRLAVAVGGRLFPAISSFARFAVVDAGDRLAIDVRSGASPVVSVECRATDELPASSAFGSLEVADSFLRSGSRGRSPGRGRGPHDVVDLAVDDWDLRPADVVSADVALFDRWWRIGREAEWDSAFILRDVACHWHGSSEAAPAERPLICAPGHAA
jgi:hypothetical protein